MKKHLLFTILAFAALITVSAARPRISNSTRQVAQPTISAMSTPAPTIKPQAVGQTAADYEAITDWESRGTVKYRDCIATQAWGDGSYYKTYNVDIEESASNPGLFRVKNPVLNNPGLYDGDAATDKDYYMIVDATDPTAVVIPECNYGLIDYNTGLPIYVQSFSNGTVEDLTVTFPEWGLGFKIGESGSWAVASGYGYTFELKLPGAKDYTMSFEMDDFCNADNTATFTLTPGNDIATMKYAFFPGATLADARASETTITGGEKSLPMTEEGIYTLAIVGLDTDGNEQATVSSTFYRYDDNADQWKTLGTTIMTEDFVETFFRQGMYGPNTYQVEIQENINTPGYYRIPNPIANNSNSYFQWYNYHETDHNHYIFIHAEDPEAVTISEAPVGLNFYGFGDVIIASYQNNTGSLNNGVITIPAGSLYIQMGNSYASLNSTDFSVVIPAEHTVTVKNADEAYGSVAIADPETAGNSVTTTNASVTVTATPADGAAFMNWTDADGNVLSTEATYTYVGSADFELTAHFGLSVIYPTPDNGGLVVTTGGSTVMSGSVYAPGTEITIRAVPASGMQLNELTINGEPVATDSNNEYSLTLSTSIEIDAVFGVQTYTLTILTEGNGELQVWSEFVEDESADNYMAPAGKQYQNGDQIELGSTIYLYFRPGNGDTLTSFNYNGIDGMDELTEAAYDPSVLVGFIGVEGDISVSAKFSGEQQGLDSIGIDPANGPVEYYNLQGIRVAEGNLVPGFYILRQGSKAVKILIRK